MNSDPFARKPLQVAAMLGVGASVWLLVAGGMTAPAVRATLAGQPLPGDPWIAIILVDGFILLINILTGYFPVVQLCIKFTPDGIKKPGFPGLSAVLPWQDVRQVTVMVNKVTLTGPHQQIALWFMFYRDGQALLEAIQQRVPAGAFPVVPVLMQPEERAAQQDAAWGFSAERIGCGVLVLALISLALKNIEGVAWALILGVGLVILFIWKWVARRLKL